MCSRLLVLVALVLGSLTALAPTFWSSLDLPFPHQRLRLGVDLQGGIALVLAAQLETAVAMEVEADVDYLRAKIEAGDLPGASIRVASWNELEILGELPPREVVQFVTEHLGAYEPVRSRGSVHRFRLSERWQRQIEESAMASTVEHVRQRVADTCLEDATVEPIGDDLVAVTLPGTFDLSEPPCR